MAFENFATYLVGLIENLGVSYADWIFLGVVLATMIFLAEDFRYGIYIMFVVQGFLLVTFLEWGIPIVKVLYMAFLLLILMTFTIIRGRSSAGAGTF